MPSASSLMYQTPSPLLGCRKTNSQYTAEQLALTISLHHLLWLSLAQKMKSLEEEKMERIPGQAALKHVAQRWKGALESQHLRQQPVRGK